MTPGQPLSVECWGPTIPVDSLSEFYNCGSQRQENGTCFLLEDSAPQVEDEQFSSRVGLAAAYACFGGGIFLILLALYFRHRNKQVYETERQDGETIAEEQVVDVDDGNDEEKNLKEERIDDGPISDHGSETIADQGVVEGEQEKNLPEEDGNDGHTPKNTEEQVEADGRKDVQ
jgi:hypothetical protein